MGGSILKLTSVGTLTGGTGIGIGYAIGGDKKEEVIDNPEFEEDVTTEEIINTYNTVIRNKQTSLKQALAEGEKGMNKANCYNNIAKQIKDNKETNRRNNYGTSFYDKREGATAEELDKCYNS